jgi:hypothetical protein
VFLLVTVPMFAGVANADPMGSWAGSIRCSYGSGSLNLEIDDLGKVKGSVTNGKIQSGQVSGRSIEFTTNNAFGNVVHFVGRVGDGTMSGTYTQSVGGHTCNWEASQRVSYGPTTTKRDTRELYLKDAKDALDIARGLAEICTYADQMRAAEFLQQAARAYNAAGAYPQETRAKLAAREIVKDGGTADRCNARNKSAANPKSNKNTKQRAAAPERAPVGKVNPKLCKEISAYADRIYKQEGKYPTELLQPMLKCRLAMKRSAAQQNR